MVPCSLHLGFCSYQVQESAITTPNAFDLLAVGTAANQAETVIQL